MWVLNYRESWALKNWCVWTVVLEMIVFLRVLRKFKSLELKEIHPIHPKGISPEYSLEGIMLKLKLQYFGHLMCRVTHLKRLWCWERLKAGGERDDRGWDGWMASPTQWTWVWVYSRSCWWTRSLGVLQSMGLQRVGHDWVTGLNWTELIRFEGFWEAK